MEKIMKLLKDVDSANAALTLRNTLWALPYLAVLGLSLGYLAGGLPGAFVGLTVAATVSAVIGPATTILTGMVGGRAVNVFYGIGRKTIGLREQLVGDLNVAKHHKLCDRFDDALIKIEDILAKDPEFPEALFLKAQILWQGFEDREAAKQCLLKIIKLEPDKETVFHRWALNLYGDIQKNAHFKKDDANVSSNKI
jgi:tetratricopeptide (TPR) repeat protein